MNQPTTPNTVEDFLTRFLGHSDGRLYRLDQVRAAILADRAQRAATDIEPHMKRCDEMRDALCECKDKLRAATEQIVSLTVAGSVDTLEDGVEHSEFRDIVQDIISEAHGDHSGEWAYKCPSWKKLVSHINARLAPAAPSGEVVAWYDPTNKNPGQSVTFDRAKRDGWPHMHPVALFRHPAPSEIEAAVELPEIPKAQHDFGAYIAELEARTPAAPVVAEGLTGFIAPDDAWNDYATRSGLINELGVAPDPAKTQTAYFAFQAAWNQIHGQFTNHLIAHPVAGSPADPSDKHLPGWERGIATVTMNGHQLREALEFIAPGPDADPDELENELTFGIVQHADDDGKVTTGLCCWNDDTDGVMPLDDEPPVAAEPMPASEAPDLTFSEVVLLAGIQALCISADQEWCRQEGKLSEFDNGWFTGQLHIFDLYTGVEKSAIAEARAYIEKLSATAAPVPASEAASDIEQRTEEIRLRHGFPHASRKQLAYDVECLLAHIALLRAQLEASEELRIELLRLLNEEASGSTFMGEPVLPPRPDVSEMVNRFLGWPLPQTFAPDCGISFDGRKDDEWNKNKTWPIGTNLFNADQARAMFEYVLATRFRAEGGITNESTTYLAAPAAPTDKKENL